MSWEIDFSREFIAASASNRSGIVTSYMTMTGYSKQQLYRIAQEHGFQSGRKNRTDKGQLKSGVTDSQLIFVAGLLHASKRENKGVIMPVECALEIANDNGIIEQGSVTHETVRRMLRERQINKAALDAATPSTDMRSLHPNHVHLIDASVCIQYYLKNGKTAIMDERDYNEKKPQNMAKIKQRLTRYLLTDHFSGAFYVKYYVADGESANILYDFLISAWSHKQDDRYPFRGVPFLILWDSASSAKARAMQSFISGLYIETPPGMPHNPRRQGSVETTQSIVEEWFESKLRFEPAFEIEKLNQWALDWCIHHNAARKHSRHGMKRTECWTLITKEQLRELPEREILQAIYSYTSEDNTRLVAGNYSITYTLKAGEIKTYHLKHIPGLLPLRSRVQVRIKPYLWPEIDVIFNEQTYAVTPVEMLPAVQGGFRADAAIIGQSYRAQPETATQKAIKQIENYAYGENRSKDAVPFAGIQVMGGQADKLGNLSYLERKGTAIEVDRGVANSEIPITELFKRIIQEGIPMSKELNQQLRAEFGASITKSRAEEVIGQIKAGEGFHSTEEDKEAAAM